MASTAPTPTPDAPLAFTEEDRLAFVLVMVELRVASGLCDPAQADREIAELKAAGVDRGSMVAALAHYLAENDLGDDFRPAVERALDRVRGAPYAYPEGRFLGPTEEELNADPELEAWSAGVPYSPEPATRILPRAAARPPVRARASRPRRRVSRVARGSRVTRAGPDDDSEPPGVGPSPARAGRLGVPAAPARVPRPRRRGRATRRRAAP